MRIDGANFSLKNRAKSKAPRFTIELAFDSGNTILWYFTSHADYAAPTGASVIANVVEGLSGTSQTINPDQALSTIGSMSFNLVDKSSAVNNQLGAQLLLGRSTRQQRVRFYIGYEDLAWADYQLIQTQLVSEITYKDGTYSIKCADIQRAMRKDIFELATTNITTQTGAPDVNLITDTATTIYVGDTSKFTMVAHGVSYSDAPSATVGYFKLEDEIIRYTGTTATTFTGCTRGVLNTRAAVHKYDTSQTSAERQLKVEEFVYLEMPAPKLAYALLTGVLHGQSATLPSKWHLGISTDFVRLADFTGIGVDQWDTTNDERGFVLRFEGLEKTDGKAFIEKELGLLMGAFMPVYADGALGLKRMASVLAGSAYVAQLDDTNIVSYDELVHDFKGLHNQIQIEWNYIPEKKRTTRTTLLIDSESAAIHGSADPYKVKFRGLHGSRHADTILESRFASIRDRYTGPPLRHNVEVLPSLNWLEVGDVVRVKNANVRDFIVSGTLDRSFEVQNVQIDWLTGAVRLSLFASSRAAAPSATIAGTTSMGDAYYTVGTDLATVLTITGTNPAHISASGNLAGNADMTAAGAIYYYNGGDLTLDAGVSVTVNNNVQLRVKGFFTVNGTIDGKGRGLAGATAPAAACTGSCPTSLVTAGTQGYIGSTKSGGAVDYAKQGVPVGSVLGVITSVRDGYLTQGLNPSAPALELKNDAGTTLYGIPSDARGTSGGSGAVTAYYDNIGSMESGTATQTVTAGNGGSGGAGLAVISRGMDFGASGQIDLSGNDGSLGTTYSDGTYTFYSGSGAGGAPGALIILLDGSSFTLPDLTSKVTLQNGIAPIGGTQLSDDFYAGILSGKARLTDAGGADPMPESGTYSARLAGFAGTSDYPRPVLSSGAGYRIQRVPANKSATADADSVVLSAPSAFTVESGTNALLVNGDGTVISRIKCTWTPPTDSRVLAYDLQFKPSADTLWSGSQTIFGASNSLAYLTPVKDSVAYDIRIRSAADVRQVSNWLTITNHIVIGKTEPPSDVAWLSVAQNGAETTMLWGAVSDADLFGYELRYHPVGTPSWSNGVLITRANKGTQITTNMIPTGSWTFLIKALDTSNNTTTASGRNESVNATSFDADITTDFDVIQQKEQSPSWLGVISATGDQVLLEDGTSFLLLEDGDFAMLESANNTFVRHWTGALIPESTALASAHTNAELFEQFVPFPQPTCIYEAPEFDLDIDGQVRVWGDIRSVLGRGATGIASPDLQIDYRTQAGIYDGWETWGVGIINARYIKHRVVLTTSEGRAKITAFLPTADSLERTEKQTVTVSATGTAVTFLTQFHITPSVSAFNTGSTPLTATVTGITTTGCTVHLYDSTGTEVGGTARIEATGV